MLFKRALAIKERTLGKDHFETAGDMRRLSSLYEDQSRYTEAELLAGRTLTILEKEYGQNNPVRLLDALEDYARLLRRLGRSNKATGFEVRAKEIRAKHNIWVPTQIATPNSPGVFVDPRQVSPAAVNPANVSPENVQIINPPPSPGKVKEGTSTAPSTSRESKKPAKKKPRKRSNN
jgi:Tetratricopeptide repeat